MVAFSDTCYVCGRPATGFFNVMAHAASSASAQYKPVCDEHNPYSFTRQAWQDIGETFFRELKALTPEQYEAYMADLKRWYYEDAVRPNMPHGRP